MKITKQRYVEYIINTPVNYTCTNLADHLDNISHDAINDYLRRERHTAHGVWELAESLINNGNEAYLIFDDSVQDKGFSKKIERVKRQYSGNAHGLAKGIGVVNLVHADKGDYYPLDFRIYSPDADGKTKNDHFRDMLQQAFEEKGIKEKTILFDCWYAASENLKYIHCLDKFFVTTLKENRHVSLSKEQGYIHLQQIEWADKQLQYGLTVKLKEVPFKVQLFKVVTPHGYIEWVIMNRTPGSIDTQVVQNENQVRWFIEQLHRELKQLTGIERCQCRKQRAQRNHFACCYHAWFSLKVIAKKTGQTLYQIKHNLWSDYLRNELRNPHITAYQPA
ncbi:MAG: transposase [Candidatus Competibacteraceae bacterium]|nr:transposase [Candidatus Competibacteraceae bacterium]